jgi:hypothetical protein
MPFEHEVGLGRVFEAFDDSLHAAQVAQAFFAGVGDQPQIAGEENILGAQAPEQTKQAGHAQGIIPQARAVDVAKGAPDGELGLGGENGIEVGGDD